MLVYDCGMIQDRHRPSYHHLPDEGLLWDPCAAVFRDGRYHLFYLHDSWAAAGPSKRSDGYNYKAWAHVSSADLVHWQRHPDAIARGQTGNLFDWNGTPAIVFPHPDGGGASCFASNPEGDLERWRFDPRGAVLRHPAQGNSLYPSNNDVTAWQEGEWCYVLTGTRDQRHGGDAQHLFRSRNPLAQGASHGDTAAWEYVHQFYRSRREWTDANDDCACPDFFRIGSGAGREVDAAALLPQRAGRQPLLSGQLPRPPLPPGELRPHQLAWRQPARAARDAGRPRPPHPVRQPQRAPSGGRVGGRRVERLHEPAGGADAGPATGGKSASRRSTSCRRSATTRASGPTWRSLRREWKLPRTPAMPRARARPTGRAPKPAVAPRSRRLSAAPVRASPSRSPHFPRQPMP